MWKCAITGAWSSTSAATGPTAHDASLEVTPIVPPSVDIHTLAQYAGLPSDDPLRGPSPHFYRAENMLTLDDETSVEFRSLNVWLEGTVRRSPFPADLFYRFFLLEAQQQRSLYRNVMTNIKSLHGASIPSRHLADQQSHSRPRTIRRDLSPLYIISACTLRAHVWRINPVLRYTLTSWCRISQS